MIPSHSLSSFKPSQQLTCTYRDREQQSSIRQTVQRMRYEHPDVTCLSYYSGLSGGTVRMELHSLREDDGPLKDDESNEKRATLMNDLRKAAEWLKKALTEQKLLPEEQSDRE